MLSVAFAVAGRTFSHPSKTQGAAPGFMLIGLSDRLFSMINLLLLFASYSYKALLYIIKRGTCTGKSPLYLLVFV